jgi:hypothetical protein
MADNKYLLPGSTTMIRIVNIDIERQRRFSFFR